MQTGGTSAGGRDANRPTGKWYFVVTIASGGLLAAVPFFHAASALARPDLRKAGVRYAVAAVVGFVLVGLAPTDANGDATGWLSNLAGGLMLLVIVAATVQQVGLRKAVYGGASHPAAGPRQPHGHRRRRAGTREAA